MRTLPEIEEARGPIPAPDRSSAAGPVLADLAFESLAWDDDDLNAAARRGILLAAAEGNPSVSAGAGSRAALETAADLAGAGYGDSARVALVALAETVPADCPLVRAALSELIVDERAALEAFAVVILHRSLA
jgi:hypothetical protein